MFLNPEDVEKVRVGSLLSQVAKRGLGLFLYPHEAGRRYNETVMI